jgi:hypothetical protein
MKSKLISLERELSKQRKGRQPILPLLIDYVIGKGYVLSSGVLRELGIKHPEAEPARFEYCNREQLDRIHSSLLQYLPAAYIVKPGDPLIDRVALEPSYNGEPIAERQKHGDYIYFKGIEQRLLVFYYELQPEPSPQI